MSIPPTPDPSCGRRAREEETRTSISEIPCKLALAAQNKRRLNCLRAELQLIAVPSSEESSNFHGRFLFLFPCQVRLSATLSLSLSLSLSPSPSPPPTSLSLSHSAPSSSSSHFSHSILFFSPARARFNRWRCVMFLLNSVIFGWQTLIIAPPIYSPSLSFFSP